MVDVYVVVVDDDDDDDDNDNNSSLYLCTILVRAFRTTAWLMK